MYKKFKFIFEKLMQKDFVKTRQLNKFNYHKVAYFENDSIFKFFINRN